MTPDAAARAGAPARILVISSAYGGALVAVVQDGRVLAHARRTEEHGLAGALPALVAGLVAGAPPDIVAVVVGPGSFTGLRAGLSVAHGVGLGSAAPVVGVAVDEALAEGGAALLDGRVLWTAIAARRGRVFLMREGRWQGCSTDAVPAATGRVAVCGNAAKLVAGALAARGTDVMLTALGSPAPVDVAAVARRRLAGEAPPLDAVPLYVDAPEAKRPDGLRPAPDAPPPHATGLAQPGPGAVS